MAAIINGFNQRGDHAIVLVSLIFLLVANFFHQRDWYCYLEINQNGAFDLDSWLVVFTIGMVFGKTEIVVVSLSSAR